LLTSNDLQPCLPTDNARDMRLDHAILLSELGLTHPARSVTCSDRSDLSGGQFRSARTFSPLRLVGVFPLPVSVSGRTATAFRHHVPSVVEIRSNEEMRRVHARRVVAVMANEQPYGDGSVHALPSEAVSGEHSLSYRVPEPAVSASTSFSLPHPTPIALLNVPIKEFGFSPHSSWRFRRGLETRPSAEGRLMRPGPKATRPNAKTFATTGTFTLYFRHGSMITLIGLKSKPTVGRVANGRH
jgi:hypothetical protein